MKTLNRLAVAIAVASAFAISAPALADTISLTFDNPIYANGSDQVTVTHPGGSTNTNAGEFEATVDGVTGAVTTDALVDSASDFFLYCYDLLHYISPGGSYTYTVDYDAAAQRTLNFLGAVNYVLNGNSNTWADPFAWLHPTSAGQSAAIQLGIWESLYDVDIDNWSLSTGNLHASGVDAGTTTAYNGFIAALAAANDVNTSTVIVLNGEGQQQSQITGLRPSTDTHQLVPEPGTLALLATGLLAAGFARRRKS